MLQCFPLYRKLAVTKQNNMNHISKLQQDKKQLTAQVQALETGMRDLIAFMQTSKFTAVSHLQHYINTGDVTAMLRETMSAALITKEATV